MYIILYLFRNQSELNTFVFKPLENTVMVAHVPTTLVSSCIKARYVDKVKQETDETDPDAKLTENQAVVDLKDRLKELTTDAVNIFVFNNLQFGLR